MSEIDKNDSIVRLQPIVREGWLPAGHDGEIRYTSCFERLMPVRSALKRAYMTGLSEKEARELEKILRLPVDTLSEYNEDFWGDYKNGVDITRDGIVLNLEYPIDRIKLSWLKQHPRVAKSEAEKYDDPSYDYVLTSVIQQAERKNKKRALYKTAVLKLAELSLSEKIDVLKVYGKKIESNTSEELIEDYINTFVEEFPSDFLEIVEDKEFKTKVLLKEAIDCKAILTGSGNYQLNGGEVFAYDMDSAVEYLNDPANAAIKKQIVAKTKLAKK